MLYFLRNIKIIFDSYIELIKPNIIFANLLSTTVGYFFSFDEYFELIKFFFLTIGLFFIISGSCVLNNILDKEIDAKMSRTKNRALVKGNISVIHAYIYAFFLFACGTFFLLSHCDLIVYLAALFASFVYVIVYTLILKRRSKYSIIFGSISGACPILIGYLANNNYYSIRGLVLFCIFYVWQIPHSYSISLLHLKDYKKAKIPVFPAVSELKETIENMYFYVNLLMMLTIFFGLINLFSYFYYVIFFSLGFFWLYSINQGYLEYLKKTEWSFKIFKISIFYVLCLDFFIIFNRFIF
ncbi:heme o synthase [Buchnera aphidicola]|uniref:heme o synthase n=1 Tax=Buchnera aphidicola TaxID=9 RepID=UPI002093EEEF|nr:heme o synthase [Buchnera aphidicola]USS94037.1 heme o synthase [Buchnera aphidicola (Sipha maydis)]